MFELTTCAVMRPNGRDCNADRMEGAPLPLCVAHMRAAYLFFASHLRSLPEFTDEQQADWAQVGKSDEGWYLPEQPEIVYYVLIGFHVKIGTTRDMQSRMSALFPDEILAIEPGGRELEGKRHRQFNALLAKGREYFHPGAALQEHIRKLQEIDWQPPAYVAHVPGPVRGYPCPSCDCLGLYHDGTTIGCIMCKATTEIPGYPPEGHVRGLVRAVDRWT